MYLKVEACGIVCRPLSHPSHISVCLFLEVFHQVSNVTDPGLMCSLLLPPSGPGMKTHLTNDCSEDIGKIWMSVSGIGHVKMFYLSYMQSIIIALEYLNNFE